MNGSDEHFVLQVGISYLSIGETEKSIAMAAPPLIRDTPAHEISAAACENTAEAPAAAAAAHRLSGPSLTLYVHLLFPSFLFP